MVKHPIILLLEINFLFIFSIFFIKSNFLYVIEMLTKSHNAPFKKQKKKKIDLIFLTSKVF